MLIPLLCSLLASTPLPQEPADLLLRDVRVFDAPRARVGPPSTVVVRDGRIEEVREGDWPVAAARVVEGKGRLLVPGFVDTHIHLQLSLSREAGDEPAALEAAKERDYLDLLAERHLAFGSTSVADMGQPPAWLDTTLGWSRSERTDAPRLFVVGSSLCSKHSWDGSPPPHHLIHRDGEAIRATLEDYAERGLERIKLYWKLKTDDMAVAVEEAGKQGLVPFAHIDNDIAEMRDALEMGVRHFEHFFTLIPGILDFRQHSGRLAQAYGRGNTRSIDEFAAKMVLYFDYVKNDEDLNIEMHALLEDMAAEGATLSTALNILAASAGRTHVFTAFDPYPERQTPDLPSLDEAGRARLAKAFDALLHYVKVAWDTGVELRIGTDSREGGASLLAELELLVEAGIPLEEVLKIATWNGARALEATDRIGSIEPGKAADLVLFDGDPFRDLAALRGPFTVFKGGVAVE